VRDDRLDRLQLLAVILPVAYIAGLVIIIASVGLPLWAEVLTAVAITVPVVVVFSNGMFRVIGDMRDELVHREERFRGLLESAPDAIVIVNSEGRIVMVNEQVKTIFGYAAGELIGRPVEMLIPTHLRGVHEQRRADYHQGPGTRPMGAGLALIAMRKDGTTFPAEISLSPIQADEGLLVTSVIRDVTERRRFEQERERLMAEAEGERERQRIGMDLHDGVIQSIYAVGLNLEAAADDIAENPGEVGQRIDRAINQLNDTIADIRSYIFELRPTRYNGDLGESLANLAQEFRVNSLIETTVEIAPGLPPLDPERSMALFHIAQEALNNVRKHARASAVALRVAANDGRVQLEISDNGAGFDTLSEFSDDHRGLRNMSSRARAAGGTLTVESAPENGTTTRVAIPAGATAGEAR
jgi:PAS domain S-box-containing protein